MSWPPASTRSFTRSTCFSGDASPAYQAWTWAPRRAPASSMSGRVRAPSVVSKAKLRPSASARSRPERPISQACALAVSCVSEGLVSSSVRAARSGLKQGTLRAWSAAPPMLLLPAPLTPARTKMRAAISGGSPLGGFAAARGADGRLAQFGRGHREGVFHRLGGLVALHAGERVVELPRERIQIGFGRLFEREVAVDRHQHHGRLVVAGDDHGAVRHDGAGDLLHPRDQLGGRNGKQAAGETIDGLWTRIARDGHEKLRRISKITVLTDLAILGIFREIRKTPIAAGFGQCG